MTTIGVYEAKTHLPKLLNRVAKGEKITITRHGVPVAILKQPETTKKPSPQAVIKNLRKFRTNHSLGDLSLKKMIEAGRR